MWIFFVIIIKSLPAFFSLLLILTYKNSLIYLFWIYIWANIFNNIFDENLSYSQLLNPYLRERPKSSVYSSLKPDFECQIMIQLKKNFKITLTLM